MSSRSTRTPSSAATSCSQSCRIHRMTTCRMGKQRTTRRSCALSVRAERASRISGSRFVYRVGDVALLELALYRFALDRLVDKGFVPMLPPVLVREEAMYGTGFFPAEK